MKRRAIFFFKEDLTTNVNDPEEAVQMLEARSPDDMVNLVNDGIYIKLLSELIRSTWASWSQEITQKMVLNISVGRILDLLDYWMLGLDLMIQERLWPKRLQKCDMWKAFLKFAVMPQMTSGN